MLKVIEVKALYNKVNKKVLKEQLLASDEQRTTLSFYKYHPIKNVRFFRDYLFFNLSNIHVFGRIYIAEEGINGQISVPDRNLDKFKKFFDDITFLNGIRLNYAIEDDGKSFYVLKIKQRKKIVADGLDDSTFDPSDGGTHLDAKLFNELSGNPDTVIVDMRNHYESEVGHFDGAITPDVETFRESLPIIEEMLEPHKDQNIIMYCTGGIRCEKASAYYKHKGFKNVYQLDGGIIEYSRQVKEQGLENRFRGKNFVFDDRLGEQISEEIISVCHQCGTPSARHINCANDACHLLFIQCPSCAEKYNDCCSKKCTSHIALPKEEQVNLNGTIEFNGSKFGKGRYRARNDKGVSLKVE